MASDAARGGDPLGRPSPAGDTSTRGFPSEDDPIRLSTARGSISFAATEPGIDPGHPRPTDRASLPLDAITLPIRSIAIGLAVDASIHFVHNSPPLP